MGWECDSTRMVGTSKERLVQLLKSNVRLVCPFVITDHKWYIIKWPISSKGDKFPCLVWLVSKYHVVTTARCAQKAMDPSTIDDAAAECEQYQPERLKSDNMKIVFNNGDTFKIDSGDSSNLYRNKLCTCVRDYVVLTLDKPNTDITSICLVTDASKSLSDMSFTLLGGWFSTVTLVTLKRRNRTIQYGYDCRRVWQYEFCKG